MTSRSEMKRIAVLKGEKMPTFEKPQPPEERL